MQGASILFCPMCNKVPLQHSYANCPPYYSHFVARAHENRCWLIAADWIWANDGEMVCPGNSCIYDPDGREISRSHKGLEKFQLPLMFLGLSVPCITALVMICTSSNEMLITDFGKRLLLFKISVPYALFILFLMPCIPSILPSN